MPHMFIGVAPLPCPTVGVALYPCYCPFFSPLRKSAGEVVGGEAGKWFWQQKTAHYITRNQVSGKNSSAILVKSEGPKLTSCCTLILALYK